MSSFRQFNPRASPLPAANRSLCSRYCHRFYFKDVVKENDIVLLKHRNNSNNTPLLTPPLRKYKEFKFQHDSIPHNELIGKEVGLGLVTSRKRIQFRIHRPTLGEYTDYSPRIVTPIYSQDASLIVSLLDIHPTVPGAKPRNWAEEEKDGTLEVFEAGTGHGALTLHLIKAIHGGNTAAPTIPDCFEAPDEFEPPLSGDMFQQQDREMAYNLWRSTRRAIIHTLDISATNSAHAKRVVRNFRSGIYFPHVDFHIGSIKEYINSRLSETKEEPFLDHAILDLPDTQESLELVSKALKPNGTLITFCPSITQINACVLYAKEKQIPIFLEKVLELGGAVGVGGREWDVRPVKPRAVVKAAQKVEMEEDMKVEEQIPGNYEARAAPDSKWEMVCRPKVGVKTVGGGFIGVWRRMVVEEN